MNLSLALLVDGSDFSETPVGTTFSVTGPPPQTSLFLLLLYKSRMDTVVGTKRPRPQDVVSDEGAKSAPPTPAQIAADAKALARDKENSSVIRCVRDGLRCVQPYIHAYGAHAKRRWLGQNIVDFYSKEYGALDRDYVQAAVAAGAIRVNGKPALVTHTIQDSNKVERFLHHHEPRVPGEAIVVVAITADVCVVSKPAGIPVHASGPYRYNTLLSLLVAENGMSLAQLNPVHRLDRLTSGLVVLARHKAAAQKLGQAMVSRELRKRYVMEVEGEFPVCPDTNNPFSSSRIDASPASQATNASEAASASLLAIAEMCAKGGGAITAEGDSAALRCDWPFLCDVSGETEDAAATKACSFLRGFRPSALAEAALAHGGDEEGDTPMALPADAPAVTPSSSSVAWTTGGWLRVSTGIAGVDIKNCVSAVTDHASGTVAGHPSGAEGAAVGNAEGINSKLSVTLFRRLGVVREHDASCPGGVRVRSLVEASPLTGRTHQLRVHAAWLGFAIVDDPIYCPRARERMAAVDTLSAVIRTGAAAGSASIPMSGGDAGGGSSSGSSGAGVSSELVTPQRLSDVCDEQREWEQLQQEADSSSAAGTHIAAGATGGPPAPPGAPALDTLVRLCAYCRRGPGAEFNAAQLMCRGLRLHSLAYRGPTWAFACPPPAWAAAYYPSAPSKAA